MQNLESLRDAQGLLLVISKWNKVVLNEKERNILIVKSILHVVVREYKVAVIALVLDV